jgi:hypothetical protein
MRTLAYPVPTKLDVQADVPLARVPEGDDRLYKYSEIYRSPDAVILNKTDLLPLVEFNLDRFQQGVERINPGIDLIPCRAGPAPISAAGSTGYGPDAETHRGSPVMFVQPDSVCVGINLWRNHANRNITLALQNERGVDSCSIGLETCCSKLSTYVLDDFL